MADEVRHDQHGKSDERRAPEQERYERHYGEQDEPVQGRNHSSDPPALTRREREERWPIG